MKLYKTIYLVVSFKNLNMFEGLKDVWKAADSAACMPEVATLVTIIDVLSQDLYICQHNFWADPITEKVQIYISA